MRQFGQATAMLIALESRALLDHNVIELPFGTPWSSYAAAVSLPVHVMILEVRIVYVPFIPVNFLTSFRLERRASEASTAFVTGLLETVLQQADRFLGALVDRLRLASAMPDEVSGNLYGHYFISLGRFFVNRLQSCHCWEGP